VDTPRLELGLADGTINHTVTSIVKEQR
jgi:hypothetical protein